MLSSALIKLLQVTKERTFQELFPRAIKVNFNKAPDAPPAQTPSDSKTISKLVFFLNVPTLPTQ